MTSDDHDVLIEIASDIKHLVEKFAEHQEADAIQFKSLNEGQIFLNKAIWVALGAGTAVAFIIKLIIK